MKKLSYIAAAFLFTGMLSAQQIDLNAMPKPGATPTINIAKPKHLPYQTDCKLW